MQHSWLRLHGDQVVHILIDRKKDIFALLICWAVVLVVFSRVLFPNHGGIIFGYDVLWLFHPSMDFAFDAYRNGGLPLWNPHLFLGFPQYAEPQLSTFYPLMGVMAWMSAAQAISWLYFLHFGLTATGMYLLARRQGARQAGGMLAALSWSLGGFYIAHLFAGHLPHLMTLTYLPWLLLGGGIAFQSTKWTKAVLAALPLGLAMLAGYAPFFVLLVLAVTIQMLWYALKTWRSTRSWKRTLIVPRQWITLGVVGGLIASVQLLPTIEMAQLSSRAASADYDFASQLSLPPWSLPTLLLPDLYGSPVGDNYYLKAELYEYWEYALYIGVLPLVLLVIAIVTRERRISFWWWLGGIGLLLALGPLGLLHRLAYYLIPGFGLFRVPARFSALFGMSVAIVAGVTIDAITFKRKNWFRHVILLTTILSIVFFFFALFVRQANENAQQQSLSANQLFWLLFLVTASISVILSRDLLPELLYIACIVGLILLDLTVWGYRFIEIAPEIEQGWQVAHTILPPDRNTFRIDSAGFQKNQAMLYSFQHVGGYDEFRTETSQRLDDLRQENASLEQMLGIRYKVQEERESIPADATWHLLSTLDGVNVFEREGAFPRAFVVYDVIGVPDVDSAYSVLTDPQHDWRQTAVVEVMPNTQCDISDPHTVATVDIIKYDPNEIELSVQTDTIGWLVLTDLYYPGWQATIDGDLVPIQPTNAALRGICVPAGTHDVTFSFQPILLAMGATFSLLGVFLLIIAGVSQFLPFR